MMDQSNNKDNNNNPILPPPKPSSDYHNFRLFSYLSMAIVTMAIIVGLYFVWQHVSLEERQDILLQNQQLQIKNQELQIQNQEIQMKSQKNILHNQDLINVLLNETRENNKGFFEILEDMTVNQTQHFEETLHQSINNTEENKLKLNQILEQGVKLDAENDKKINKILESLNIN